MEEIQEQRKYHGDGTPGKSKPKGSIKGGAKSLVGKYGKSIGGTALGALTGGAGAMIGFAAGVAQGDIGAAFTGALAGGAAGKSLGKGAVNLPGNIASGVKSGWNNISDTWNTGAYGEDYANNVKLDREFRKSSTYKALKDNPNFSEASVQAMLEAGITERGAMEKILNNNEGNISEAIGYYTIAKKCPESIYYGDDATMEMYLQDLGLSETDAAEMRKKIRKYR